MSQSSRAPFSPQPPNASNKCLGYSVNPLKCTLALVRAGTRRSGRRTRRRSGTRPTAGRAPRGCLGQSRCTPCWAGVLPPALCNTHTDVVTRFVDLGRPLTCLVAIHALCPDLCREFSALTPPSLSSSYVGSMSKTAPCWAVAHAGGIQLHPSAFPCTTSCHVLDSARATELIGTLEADAEKNGPSEAKASF